MAGGFNMDELATVNKAEQLAFAISSNNRGAFCQNGLFGQSTRRSASSRVVISRARFSSSAL
jgi:hypothetical protein